MAAKFTTQHYVAIAEVFQEVRANINATDNGGRGDYTRIASQQAAVNRVENALARMFARTYQGGYSFNESLFHAACKPGANVNAKTVEGMLRGVS